MSVIKKVPHGTILKCHYEIINFAYLLKKNIIMNNIIHNSIQYLALAVTDSVLFNIVIDYVSYLSNILFRSIKCEVNKPILCNFVLQFQFF